MSQNIFKDPIVSSPPVLTGVGNGTLVIDKLTHFTITQTYTVVCTAISPFTTFNVVGSLDGAVGVAIVGTQFVDEDNKIFFTINQGPTLFAVSDSFALGVEQGTDLNQANLDSYDELPQKNFGAGTTGNNLGDHNLRFSTTPVLASKVIQDLIYTSKLLGSLGNNISIEYKAGTVLTAASVTIQDLIYTAVTQGLSGNAITIEYLSGGTAGAEVVGVIGNAITVTIESGVSTSDDIDTAIGLSVPASALINTTVVGTGLDPQTAPVSATNLTGGLDNDGDPGNEYVTVVGNQIYVTFISGAYSAASIKALIEAYVPADNLVTITLGGTGTELQVTQAQTFLQGGLNEGTYAFNTEELTVPGSFFEGNANILVKDINAQGGLNVAEKATLASELQVDAEALFNDQVSLQDPAASDNFTSAQEMLYELNDTVGITGEGDATRKDYVTNNYLVDTENHKQGLEKFDTVVKSLQDQVDLGAIKFIEFANDAAYEVAYPVPTGGEVYYNSTTGLARYYDGVAAIWKNVGPEILTIQEVPAGVVNGINTDFTITNQPLNDESVIVFIDGVLQYKTDYSYDNGSGTITFVTAPAAGQTVYSHYISNGNPATPVVTAGTLAPLYHTVTAGEETAKQFTLPSTPSEPTKVLCDIIGGVSQHYGVDFTISGTTFDWSGLGLDGLLAENDVIRLYYFF